MHYIPLVTDSQTLIIGHHGVSSGAVPTNDMESTSGLIFCTFVGILHPEWKLKVLSCMGDDLTISIAAEFATPETLVEISRLAKLIGLTIHVEKSSADYNVATVLQRTFARKVVKSKKKAKRNKSRHLAIYPIMRAVNSLLYPEKVIPKAA